MTHALFAFAALDIEPQPGTSAASEQSHLIQQSNVPDHLHAHFEKLQFFCRVCGEVRVQKRNFLVSEHLADLSTFLALDVSNDHQEIHPQVMCRPCWQRIERIKKLKFKHKTVKLPSGFTPFNWEPHVEPKCAVCDFHLRRSPRKPTPSKSPSRKLFKRPVDEAGNADALSRKKLCFETFTHTGGLHSVAFDTSPLNRQTPKDLISSLPTDLLVANPIIGIHISCSLCGNVPLHPCTIACKHLYCKRCIDVWLTHNSVCNACHEPTDVTEVIDATTGMQAVYDIISTKCVYREQGCIVILPLSQYANHVKQCPCKPTQTTEPTANRRSFWKSKTPLSELKKSYVKNCRLATIIKQMDEFCSTHHESKLDVLYFLIIDELQALGDTEKVTIVKKMRDDVITHSLSSQESLAMRVDLLQSKSQYKKQYQLLKDKGDNIMATPYQVDKEEATYMAPAAEYQVIAEPHTDIYASMTGESKPVDIMEGFDTKIRDYPVPNCKGVRWHYADAVAKTLEEIDPLIEEELQRLGVEGEGLILTTTVKDGGDGLGDVAIHREKALRYLPDKALRFSFCVLGSSVELEGQLKPVFKEPLPNSVRTNRPLLEAIADENNKASAVVCLKPIEEERAIMEGNVLKVKIGPDKFRMHRMKFINSMLDEKYDRAFGGLQGAGSSYMCTLCYATNKTAKEGLGTFKVERTLDDTSQLAEYIRINPDKLSETQMQKIAKGVKASPLIKIEPRFRMIDATHADINLASFFKKLIVRSIAGVHQWDATKDVKKQLDNCEVKFDTHIKKTIGLNPQLMMPGNYARTLFDPKNRDTVTQIIPEPARGHMKIVLDNFSKMRQVYRATEPEASAVSSYKESAVSFGKMIMQYFPYANWPNYLHKIIEHVQELIEDKNGPGSIGAVSGEGNEAGNKIFRHLRKNMASKGNTQQGLIDVLKTHWLYSSPKLLSLSTVTHKKNKCGICFQEGHNRLTCPTTKDPVVD